MERLEALRNIDMAIQGFECCTLRNPDDKRRCAECPYEGNCVNRLHHDGLALLKLFREWVRYGMPEERERG